MPFRLLQLCLLLVLPLNACGLEITYSKEELQRELNKHFPQKLSVERVGTMSLVEPRLDLRSGSDRLYFQLAVEGQLGVVGKMKLAEVSVSSAIAYDASQATFFAVEPRLEGLSVSGAGQPVEAILQTAANEALPLLGRITLHRLEDDSAAKRHLKAVQIRDAEVVLTLGL
ncbi:MAG: hypothetical protein RBU37_01335 [Myxococcota bacterium]|jgi:hypothetical protein|nr:hypothetical protein [Myxococcota bacterium]